MKLYLAARYSRKDEMKAYAGMLRRGGYIVTSRWLDDPGEEWTDKECPVWKERAIIDLEDVEEADVVVSFTHPRDTMTSGGGRHVEFGYGYALGKIMIIIGEKENVFHHLPGVRIFPTLDDWLNEEEDGPVLSTGTVG